MNIKVDVDDMKPEEQNMQTGMLATESDRYQEVQLPRASVTLTASRSVSYSQKEHLEAFERKSFCQLLEIISRPHHHSPLKSAIGLRNT